MEWLQIHVRSDTNDHPGDHAGVGFGKIRNFNSKTNCMGSRKFLLYGAMKKAKSGKELAGFLFNDFLLLTLPSRYVKQSYKSSKKLPQINVQISGP